MIPRSAEQIDITFRLGQAFRDTEFLMAVNYSFNTVGFKRACVDARGPSKVRIVTRCAEKPKVDVSSEEKQQVRAICAGSWQAHPRVVKRVPLKEQKATPLEKYYVDIIQASFGEQAKLIVTEKSGEFDHLSLGEV